MHCVKCKIMYKIIEDQIIKSRMRNKNADLHKPANRQFINYL